jgi:hypothetical protein
MISRDVRWLGRSYGDHFDIKPDKILELTNLKSDDEGEEIIMVKGEMKVEEMQKKQETRTIITRSKALIDNIEDDSSDLERENRVYTTMEYEFSDPLTFKEAFHYPNKDKRTLWRQAI